MFGMVLTLNANFVHSEQIIGPEARLTGGTEGGPAKVASIRDRKNTGLRVWLISNVRWLEIANTLLASFFGCLLIRGTVYTFDGTSLFRSCSVGPPPSHSLPALLFKSFLKLLLIINVFSIQLVDI